MIRRVSVTMAVLAALALPAAAAAKTVRSSARGVTATLSYQGTFPSYRKLQLSISRNGTVDYTGAVRAAGCGSRCAIIPASKHYSPLHVLNVDGSGTPEVVLDVYTGGAHCCSVMQVFSRSASGTWHSSQRNFGDYGAKLEKLGGRGYRFVTGDDRFAYAFTDYAESGLPLQIFSWKGGHFTDVTHRYPKLIARDAARWLKLYKAQAHGSPAWGDSVGLIAAWAADEYRLGHQAAARRYLNAQAAAGHLRAPVGKGGKAFVAELEKYLHKYGYGS